MNQPVWSGKGVAVYARIMLFFICFFSLNCTFAKAQSFDELRAILKEIHMEPKATVAVRKVAKKKIIENVSQIDLHLAIEQAANAYGIPPALLSMVVTIESDADAGVVSEAGAEGLCQLMPDVSKELGVTNAFNPKQNLEGSAKLLRRLLDQHNGDLLLTMASYNAGPKVLDRQWCDWPEETKRYLEKVVALYPKYMGRNWKRYLPRNIPDSGSDGDDEADSKN